MNEELGKAVFAISAVTGKGLAQLVLQVMTKLDEVRDVQEQAAQAPMADAMHGESRPWALPVPSESVVE